MCMKFILPPFKSYNATTWTKWCYNKPLMIFQMPAQKPHVRMEGHVL